MTGIIAVHCGAGHHSSKYHSNYNKLSRKACRRGIEILRKGGTALEAAEAAIVVLENDPLTNAGFGSNLTCTGSVEADASIMDGKTLTYGGCGAIRNVKNPIKLAYNICIKQSETLSLGRIPPSLLVGKGGSLHAKKIGLQIVNNKSLISPKALNQYKKYKKMLDQSKVQTQHMLDTVGAICVDDTGYVASACSSGGILLKRPGRVGQAALYASGVWADSFSLANEPAVAVCTTGCGEHLIQTQLAKEIAQDLKTCSCPTSGLSSSMTEKFLNSRYLRNVKSKLGGALALHVNNKTGDVVVLWGHSTQSMSIGFMRTIDKNAKGMISQLPKDVAVGSAINVGGSYFYKSTDETVP